ncbi:MAG: SDR family oxidoreductase [Proteobacteria bacterium]|nr:SDR family oxidoreductase [Pseudomonadota bacterium]
MKTDEDAKKHRRSVLVTGGSRGIGAATALRCAAQGDAVAVNYTRDRAAADAVVARIRDGGGRAIAVQADVADEAQVVAMFEAVDRALPPLRGLVNNAGMIDVATRIDAITVERLNRMFAVNVTGSFVCAREAIKRLSTRHGGEGGAIVNLSSAAAKIGAASQYVDYAAAKGAIDVFTLGLARELATEGIRVNAVRPGIIATEIHATGGDADRAHKSASIIPMQRPGEADEIAQAIVWLLSDAASYTTGAILDVTGGR